MLIDSETRIAFAALALATAAIMSVQRQSTERFELSQWPLLNLGPAADVLAGAIAENPRVMIPP